MFFVFWHSHAWLSAFCENPANPGQGAAQSLEQSESVMHFRTKPACDPGCCGANVEGEILMIWIQTWQAKHYFCFRSLYRHTEICNLKKLWKLCPGLTRQLGFPRAYILIPEEVMSTCTRMTKGCISLFVVYRASWIGLICSFEPWKIPAARPSSFSDLSRGRSHGWTGCAERIFLCENSWHNTRSAWERTRGPWPWTWDRRPWAWICTTFRRHSEILSCHHGSAWFREREAQLPLQVPSQVCKIACLFRIRKNVW